MCARTAPGRRRHLTLSNIGSADTSHRERTRSNCGSVPGWRLSWMASVVRVSGWRNAMAVSFKTIIPPRRRRRS
jgi:hypothetical protein